MACSQKRGRHLGDENLSTRDEGAAASKGPFNILLLSRSLSLSERQSDSSVFWTGSGNAVGHRLAGFFFSSRDDAGPSQASVCFSVSV